MATALLGIVDRWLTEGREVGALNQIVVIVINVITSRHCNMDYLFLSSIQSTAIKLLTMSYNVCCQWHTNFWVWQKLLPISLQILLLNQALQLLVPKFHLQHHIDSCHLRYSFNYEKGVGRTDGEGVEWNWDISGAQVASTVEMTSGDCWGTLDNCSGWLDWCKTMGLGKCLCLSLQ